MALQKPCFTLGGSSHLPSGPSLLPSHQYGTLGISWPASKHLWDPAGDYGTHAYFQTPTTSQLLTSTRVLKPWQGCIGANIQIQGLV